MTVPTAAEVYKGRHASIDATRVRECPVKFATRDKHLTAIAKALGIGRALLDTSESEYMQRAWVEPHTGTLYTLPAKQRYDNGTPNLP